MLRDDEKRDWHTYSCFALVVCVVSATAFAQTSNADKDAPRARTKSVRDGRSQDRAATKPLGYLRPFYDVNYHAPPDATAAEPREYLVDSRFWRRRPTLVVVTPITPNVFQPDEAYAEAMAEAILRRIAADLGVRETRDQLAQTIDLLRKIGRSTRRSDATPKGNGEPVKPAGGERANGAPPADVVPPEEADRGLRNVQLVLLPDPRPLWSGISLFDRDAVVAKSLNEYLTRVPSKREKLLEFLDQDQFRFGAFPGKEAAIQMTDSLGIGRPGFHVLVVDRAGEVAGIWSKATIDVKQVSSVYVQLSRE